MTAPPAPIFATLPGIAADEIDAHYSRLPENYFVQADDAEVSLHIRMVNRLLQAINAADSLGTLRPVIEWQDDERRGHTTVHVVTWDRAGLFHKLAGACNVAGLNILSARITTRSDHIAIDTFQVVAAGGGPVQSRAAKLTFARTVEEALVGHADLLPAILAQAQNLHASRSVPAAAVSAPAIEIYREIRSPRLIIEIRAPDRIGLLYRVGRVLAGQDFNLSSAVVATERGQAIDCFHVEAGATARLDDARVTALHAALLAAISEATGGAR